MHPYHKNRFSKSTSCRTQKFTRTNCSDSPVVASIGLTRVTTTLNAIRVNTRRRSLGRASQRVPIASVIVYIFQVESVNVSGEVPSVKGLARLFKRYVKSPDHVEP